MARPSGVGSTHTCSRWARPGSARRVVPVPRIARGAVLRPFGTAIKQEAIFRVLEEFAPCGHRVRLDGASATVTSVSPRPATRWWSRGRCSFRWPLRRRQGLLLARRHADAEEEQRLNALFSKHARPLAAYGHGVARAARECRAELDFGGVSSPTAPQPRDLHTLEMSPRELLLARRQAAVGEAADDAAAGQAYSQQIKFHGRAPAARGRHGTFAPPSSSTSPTLSSSTPSPSSSRRAPPPTPPPTRPRRTRLLSERAVQAQPGGGADLATAAAAAAAAARPLVKAFLPTRRVTQPAFALYVGGAYSGAVPLDEYAAGVVAELEAGHRRATGSVRGRRVPQGAAPRALCRGGPPAARARPRLAGARREGDGARRGRADGVLPGGPADPDRVGRTSPAPLRSGRRCRLCERRGRRARRRRRGVRGYVHRLEGEHPGGVQPRVPRRLRRHRRRDPLRRRAAHDAPHAPGRRHVRSRRCGRCGRAARRAGVAEHAAFAAALELPTHVNPQQRSVSRRCCGASTCRRRTSSSAFGTGKTSTLSSSSAIPSAAASVAPTRRRVRSPSSAAAAVAVRRRRAARPSRAAAAAAGPAGAVAAAAAGGGGRGRRGNKDKGRQARRRRVSDEAAAGGAAAAAAAPAAKADGRPRVLVARRQLIGRPLHPSARRSYPPPPSCCASSRRTARRSTTGASARTRRTTRPRGCTRCRRSRSSSTCRSS